MLNKQSVEEEPRKKVSKNFPGTKPKVNKHPTCNAEQEPHTKKKALKDLSTTEPAPKRACKTLNKKERKGNLLAFLSKLSWKCSAIRTPPCG